MPNLVGIGNSQVPTNAMLGGLAFQDSVDEVIIKKIKARTPDTATDIFVYDTRKDSDGGAWRHRTTDKSWYNEIPSKTRGARKEFPIVAVIVIEAYEIIIYDGDDSNLSMWMRFTIPAYTVGSNYAYTPVGVVYVNAYPHNSINLSCVHMLNGQLFVGANREGNASQSFSAGFEINFINEEMYEYLHYPSSAARNSKWRLGGNISQRNSTQQTNTPTTRYGDGIGVSQNKYLGWANGVDMKVFPDDPIDPSTGLPKPTIVVASTLGISIMRGTGAMPEMTTTASNAQLVKKIQITKSNKLAFKHHSDWIYFYDIPDTNKSGSYWNSLDGYLGRFTGTNRNYQANGIPLNTEGSLPNFAEDRAIGHPNGLSLIDINTISYAGQSTGYKMHCDIGTDFNSGWQMGDVKRALLSSTDDADLSGTELVTNGNFSSNNVNGWTEREAGGSFTASGGQATLTYSSGVASWRQDIAITAGKAYHLSFQVVSTTTSSIQFYYNHGSPGGDLGVSMSGSAGIFNATFVAASNSVRIFPRIFASGNMVLDNISLREGDMDRSDHPKNGGLMAIGTVPKTPVADGAELMAYGPFDSSSYLIQDYSSDLDYGTDDFYYMIWVKLSGHSPLQGIWSRQDQGQGSGNRIQVQTVGSANGEVAIYSGVNYSSIPGSALGIGVWHHLAMVRRSGTMYWYKDGVQLVSYSDNTNYSNSNALLRLGGLNLGSAGQEYTTNHYQMSQGKLALFRTGKQAPTPEQMEKMYDDEKHLFAENAKCTLHGTSDSVVGLALDDTDDTIHAGTSSGRSQFQGLTRINNTTTAVTTVISASDKLVAEQ